MELTQGFRLTAFQPQIQRKKDLNEGQEHQYLSASGTQGFKWYTLRRQAYHWKIDVFLSAAKSLDLCHKKDELLAESNSRRESIINM